MVSLAQDLQWLKSFRRSILALRRLPVIPLAIVILFIMTALLADIITVHDPYVPDLPKRLLPPFWQEGGDLTYPLGTDAVGRDLLTRVIFGARISLVVGFASILFGGVLGVSLGIISGYFGGWKDIVIMRLTDGMLSFPTILIALLLAVVLGPNLSTVILVIGLVMWARFARLVRGEVLSIKSRDFVTLAKVAGCSPVWIILRHILPNVFNTIIVIATLQVGWVIIFEASLSFLGAGIPPPTPSWGSMVAAGRNYIDTAWWVSVMPGFALLLAVVSLNLTGDWLRDRLDPRLRQI